MRRTIFVAALGLGLATAACSGSIEGGLTGSRGEAPGEDATRMGAPRPGGRPGESMAGMGEPGAGPERPPATGCGPSPARLWPLTPDQYVHTVEALLPGAGELGRALAGTAARPAHGFSNQAGLQTMSEPHVAQLFKTARALATRALEQRTTLAACLGKSAPDTACVRGFVETFVGKAFRRPLVPAEVDRFHGYYAAEAALGGNERGLRQMLTLVFLEPDFLYRTELGPDTSPKNGPIALTPHERASALSYFLTDGPPDAALTAAAARGGLTTAPEIEAHARRLIATAAGARGLRKFLAEHYGHPALENVQKDSKLFPGWQARIAADMIRETDLFLEHVVWEADGKLSTLLTSEISFPNGRIAALLGLPGLAAGADHTRLTLPAGTRAGLLTQPSLLALLAREDESDVVLRGKFVRESLLCEELPSPPVNVNATVPPPDGVRTQRARLEAHSSDPTCVGCHQLMDPIGYGLEHFDAIGRYRTTEAKAPVDASGTVKGLDGRDAAFIGAPALGRLLAGSEAASACQAKALYRYAIGRTETDADACLVADVTRRFRESGGDLRALVVAVVTAGDFFLRRPGP